tara:strand:- start:26 stop:424 length:399 start_codon:yes stop_codon:yes gene_type:complete
MASELKVDKFTGVTTAGSILVTGEGNSTTTNLQQGLAKCWATSNTAGSAVLDSFNLSSLGDTATGKETRNFTNVMSNNDYSAVALTGTGDNNGNHHPLLNNTVGTDSYQVWAFSGSTLTDNPVASTVNGDLA